MPRGSHIPNFEASGSVRYEAAVIFTVLTAIEGWIIGVSAYWSVRWILAGRRRETVPK